MTEDNIPKEVEQTHQIYLDDVPYWVSMLMGSYHMLYSLFSGRASPT
jgi:hypothetical protein